MPLAGASDYKQTLVLLIDGLAILASISDTSFLIDGFAILACVSDTSFLICDLKISHSDPFASHL